MLRPEDLKSLLYNTSDVDTRITNGRHANDMLRLDVEDGRDMKFSLPAWLTEEGTKAELRPSSVPQPQPGAKPRETMTREEPAPSAC